MLYVSLCYNKSLLFKLTLSIIAFSAVCAQTFYCLQYSSMSSNIIEAGKTTSETAKRGSTEACA